MSALHSLSVFLWFYSMFLNQQKMAVYSVILFVSTETIFALVAQIERELISLRTREALQARKLAGVKLGRPSGKGKSRLDEHTADILRLIALKVPKTLIARQYGCSVGNLYNFLNRLEKVS